MKRKNSKISRLLYTVYLSSKSKFQLQIHKTFHLVRSSTTRLKRLKRGKCIKRKKKKKEKAITCDIQDLLNYYSYYYMRIHNFYMYIIIYYVSRYLLSLLPSPHLLFPLLFLIFIHTFSTLFPLAFHF